MLFSLCGPRHLTSSHEEAIDARASRDPTMTHPLRLKMFADGDRRWENFARTLREALIKHDMIGLRGIGQIPHGDKTGGFSAWLRQELEHKVFGLNGGWLRPYIRRAADLAATHAGMHAPGSHHDPQRVTQMESLAISELRGIVEAAQQQITRVVTHGIMASSSPTRTANQIAGVIMAMRKRTRAMSATMIVKTHATTTLSAFRNAGITQVGTIPEKQRKRPTRDANADADVDLDDLWERTKTLVARATINRDYDVIELSNRSRNGRTIYIDQDVPELLKCGIHPDDTLPWHELSEFILMNEGFKYLPAHKVATKIEKRRVEQLKPGVWDEYQEEMGGLITSVEKRGYGHEPPNQDQRVFDAEVFDAPRRRRTGPGSRTRKRRPSPSTRRRIERARGRLAQLGEVDVLTAGDDDVCVICEDISDDGPYDIDDAEGLIPAHPFCRCAFVPAGTVTDFDPNQLRDPRGRWTAGGGAAAYEFVSPAVGVAGQLPDAIAGLHSNRQRVLHEASQDIDKSLGLASNDADAIGAWSDGAENSIVSAVGHDADWEQLKTSAAMKGHIADQKAVLVFKQQDGGSAALYHFHVGESHLQTLHNNLLADGVAFHTIAPYSGGAEVYVADLDGSAHDAVAKAAERYNAEVTYQIGHAEFIGTAKQEGSDREQRDDARRTYEEIIKQSPVPRSQEIWSGVHHHWGQTLGAIRDVYNFCRSVIDIFDPDEPRDPHGRWTSSGSEGTAFERWFGNSKVIDDQGNPAVVYHHTFKQFAEFKPGGDDPELSGSAIWFGSEPDASKASMAHQWYIAVREGKGYDARGHTISAKAVALAEDSGSDSKQAEYIRGRIDEALRGSGGIEGLNTIPAYLKIENPAIFGKKGGVGKRADITLMYPETVNKLRAKGYDGAIAYERGKPVEYVVFDPRQIKSAIGNRGTFDPQSGKITDFDPDEPRDPHGRWTASGASEGTYYHGTKHEFDVFSHEAQRDRPSGAFMFTSRKRTAENYSAVEGPPSGSPRVIHAKLDLKNPKEMGEEISTITKEMADDLKAQGYDGVVSYRRDGSVDEVGVFDPGQIHVVQVEVASPEQARERWKQHGWDAAHDAFDPDEPRDPQGKWTAVGAEAFEGSSAAMGEATPTKWTAKVDEMRGGRGLEDFTAEQRGALHNYIWNSADFNTFIREGGTGKHPEGDALDSLIKQFETPRDLVVYRKIGWHDLSKKMEGHVGKDFTEPGFMSTTLDPELKFKPGSYVEIHVPKGAAALPVGSLSGFLEEAEILFPRGSRMHVESATPLTPNTKKFVARLYAH